MKKVSRTGTLLFVLLGVFLAVTACGKKTGPTLKAFEKPVAPSGLTALNREDRVHLQWEFPKDKEVTVRQLVILRADGPDFVKIAAVEPGTRFYVDAALQPDSVYRYKVAAVNDRGAFSPDSNIVMITVRRVPSPPQGLSFRVLDAALELKWEAQGSGLLYNIYRAEEPALRAMAPLNPVPLTAALFTDTLPGQKTRYYTVRTLSEATVRNESAVSAELVVNPAEFVPRPLQGAFYVASETRIFLSWDAPTEAWITLFRIYRKTPGQEYALLAETQLPAYIDQDPSAAERSYRIHAVGLQKEGAGVEITGVRLRPRE